MAVFKFIGNGKSDPEKLTAYGIAFPKGEEVEVEDKTAIAKLRGNSHFEEAGGESRNMVHRGRGKYDVFEDGEIIADNVTKAEAEALVNGDDNGTAE